MPWRVAEWYRVVFMRQGTVSREPVEERKVTEMV